MQILHLISSANLKQGGPIFGVLSLAKETAKKGHITTIICLDSNLDFDYKNSNVNIIPIGAGLKSSIQIKYKAFKYLKKNIDLYDYIFINGLWSYFGFIAWLISKKKYFVFPHGMLDPKFKKLYPWKHLKKYIYWLLIEKNVLKSAQKVIFTNQIEADLARKNFKPYSVNEAVIRYGVARPMNFDSVNSKNRLLKKYPEYIDKELILFLSRVHNKKGIELLIWSLSVLVKANPRLMLVICGEGDRGYIDEMKNLAFNLKINSNISWRGAVYEEDKLDLFFSSDVFCLPSHQENFGIALVEALSLGLPVLTTYEVNIWQEIQTYGAGFIAEDTKAGTLKNLEKFFELNDFERKKMKVAAKKCYEERFAIENFTIDFIKLLN